MSEPGYTINFQPREGILDSLSVTKEEFDETILKSFMHGRRDCRAWFDDIQVVFNGRQYLLTKVAHVQIYGPS
jgi:hypothetical protein